MKENTMSINFVPNSTIVAQYRKKVIKRTVLIIVIIALIYGIAVLYLNTEQKDEDNNLQQVQKSIESIKLEIANIDKEINKVPNLSDNIKIFEDLFVDREVKFSDLLFEIKELTPENIWYSSLKYSNFKVSLHGKSLNELDIYELEKKFKTSPIFGSVKQMGMNRVIEANNPVNEFDFDLTSKKEESKGVENGSKNTN